MGLGRKDDLDWEGFTLVLDLDIHEVK